MPAQAWVTLIVGGFAVAGVMLMRSRLATTDDTGIVQVIAQHAALSESG